MFRCIDSNRQPLDHVKRIAAGETEPRDNDLLMKRRIKPCVTLELRAKILVAFVISEVRILRSPMSRLRTFIGVVRMSVK